MYMYQSIYTWTRRIEYTTARRHGSSPFHLSLSLNDDDPSVSWMIHFFVLDSPIFTHTRAHALTRCACFPHFFYIKL